MSDFNHEKARTFFQYGNDAALKSNFDYAIQMYQEACKLHPDNLIYRQALRGIERRKFSNDPAKVGKLVGAKNQPIRMSARSAKKKGNYAEAIALCEQAFVNNPWDMTASRDAAEAAEQIGFLPLAAWFVESVLAQANDPDFLKFAAHIYELNETWPKAIACWERVKKVNPSDEDASRQINALSAKATIKRSGLGEALNKQDEGSSGPERHSAELEELKQEKLPPDVRFQREIQEHPEHVTAYLGLADFYKMRSQLDEAQKVLAKGLTAVPKDPNLQEAYAEVQMARLQKAIEQWTKHCKERPNDAAGKLKLDQLTEKLHEYELQEARRKVELNPEDFQLHFQLGQTLQRLGKHKEAIASFQQARSSQSLRVQALYLTGLSFEAVGQLKLAERNYQEALKVIEEGDVTNFLAIHYQLGRVAEALGSGTVAEEHYSEVAAIDFSYRDVAERLRNLH